MIKYNRTRAVIAGPPWQDRTARWLALGIIRAQRSIASRLQGWEQKFTRPEKKVLFFLFCLLAGGYCLCLLGSALYGRTPTRVGVARTGHLTLTDPFSPDGSRRPYADTLPYPPVHPAPTMNPQKSPQ